MEINRRKFCRMVGTGVLVMAALSVWPGWASEPEAGRPACSAWSPPATLRVAMWAGAATAGRPAPAFHLRSGDRKEISLDHVKGNVVVLFYETRETVEQNRPFKNELKALLAQSESVKAATTVLAVINCASAVWPITKIWQAKLCENSEKEQLTVYGDWDGKMAADYGMNDNASNILVMDPEGVIRYRSSGPLAGEEISKVLALVKQWVTMKGGS